MLSNSIGKGDFKDIFKFMADIFILLTITTFCPFHIDACMKSELGRHREVMTFVGRPVDICSHAAEFQMELFRPSYSI